MNSRPRGRPPYPDQLTPGEWRIVEAIRHGMTNAEIARRRGISRDAVKFHLSNALGKLGLADRAALRRWDGVRRDSALASQENEMSDSSVFGEIGQVSRMVGDIEAAVAWYRDTLGLPHLFTAGELAFFDCGGVRLYLQRGEVQSESVLYFRVPDIRSEHERLKAAGVTFEGAPHMIHRHDDGTEEWMAFFRDPDGGLLALMSQVGPD